ncbi:MAG: hypothetical protein KF857_07870 [Fimbriimonadaceae bacterium]|nr:hypothetical protein [Fimbriimonadaceae bacterium]
MTEQTKKVLAIVAAVVAVGLAAFGAYNFATSGERMEVDHVVKLPPGTKSMRDQEVENMKGGGAAPTENTGKGKIDVAGGDALAGN